MLVKLPSGHWINPAHVSMVQAMDDEACKLHVGVPGQAATFTDGPYKMSADAMAAVLNGPRTLGAVEETAEGCAEESA